MGCNIGLWDRIGRGIIGFVLIVIGLLGNPIGWVGLIPVITAFVGYCPFYSIVGLNTGCKTKA